MRDWIAGAIGLLGALLVLGGAATIIVAAVEERDAALHGGVDNGC